MRCKSTGAGFTFLALSKHLHIIKTMAYVIFPLAPQIPLMRVCDHQIMLKRNNFVQTTNNTREIYLPDHVYDALQEKLARLVEEDFGECSGQRGTDPTSVVADTLGEIGNIWPVSVLDIKRVADAA